MVNALRSALETRVRQLYEIWSWTDARHHRDIDKLLLLFDDDTVFEMPFTDPPRTMRGKDQLRSMFERTQGLFANIAYDVRSIHIDIDTQTAIVEAKGSRTLVSTGEAMTLRYVFIYRFARDLIVETHEYIHPLDAQSAMKAMKM